MKSGCFIEGNFAATILFGARLCCIFSEMSRIAVKYDIGAYIIPQQQLRIRCGPLNVWASK